MKKQKSNLKNIASQMRTYAIAHPRLNSTDPIDPYRYTLSGGLGLVLYLKLNVWHCSLYRAGVDPSMDEIRVIKRDFDIPSMAKQTSQQIDRWHIVRLEWQAEQTQLFDLQPPESDYYRGDNC